jgi:predicted transcriptional regulator
MINGGNISLFFNPAMIQVFEYICATPGSYLHKIIKENENVPGRTIRRHLEKLVEKGMIKRKIFNGKVIFYPDGLRDEDVDVAFSQFHHENRLKIFLQVLNSPGITRTGLLDVIITSRRQIERLLESMINAGLLVSGIRNGRYEYYLGEVGKRIIVGSFEKLDPFVSLLEKRLGHNVTVTIKKERDKNIAEIDLLNGDILNIKLGSWKIMEINDELIIKNYQIILGDGGIIVLNSIESGLDTVALIKKYTGKKENVIRAKISVLRKIGLLVDFTVTELGKKIIKETRIARGKLTTP